MKHTIQTIAIVRPVKPITTTPHRIVCPECPVSSLQVLLPYFYGPAGISAGAGGCRHAQCLTFSHTLAIKTLHVVGADFPVGIDWGPDGLLVRWALWLWIRNSNRNMMNHD